MPNNSSPSGAHQLGRRLKAVARDPRRVARLVKSYAARGTLPPPAPPARVEHLDHAEALRTNGFTVFRGLVPAEECAALARTFKTNSELVEGEPFKRTDTTIKIPVTRQVLFDERVLAAVRESLGEDVRFLQVGDLHYLSDTAAWHRDSVHRAQDNRHAADWVDTQGRYGIVKAILYLESDNAAMGLLPGSHLSPRAADLEAVKGIERRGGQVVVDAGDDPNRRFTDAERERPLAWRALPGDLLVFDQRLYHCGRRVDGGAVTQDRDAAKFTLSLVFGLDNMHSQRFHSYFRYARRELGYRDFPDELFEQLQANDLVPAGGYGNYYAGHPEEIRLASLQKPETMETLVADFRREGSAQSS